MCMCGVWWWCVCVWCVWCVIGRGCTRCVSARYSFRQRINHPTQSQRSCMSQAHSQAHSKAKQSRGVMASKRGVRLKKQKAKERRQSTKKKKKKKGKTKNAYAAKKRKTKAGEKCGRLGRQHCYSRGSEMRARRRGSGAPVQRASPPRPNPDVAKVAPEPQRMPNKTADIKCFCCFPRPEDIKFQTAQIEFRRDK